MEIYYQDTDITSDVQIKNCIVNDTVNRCDGLLLEFENAASWYAWGPQENDRIRALHNGYDSGEMYISRILPEDGVYRILATSLPCTARVKGNQSFCNQTIETIMRQCAMASGVGYQIFGIDPNLKTQYIEQSDEEKAAFLARFLTLEGAVLKCVNGRYTAIGIQYAQDRSPAQTMKLTANQDGMTYQRSGLTYRNAKVRTPYASAGATDQAVSETGMLLTGSNLPAMNDIQAARWARNLLLDQNRKSETVTVQSSFNPAYTAMQRIDIEGNTDATGEWLIQNVEHDLVNLKTTATLYRCRYSII